MANGNWEYWLQSWPFSFQKSSIFVIIINIPISDISRRSPFVDAVTAWHRGGVRPRKTENLLRPRQLVTHRAKVAHSFSLNLLPIAQNFRRSSFTVLTSESFLGNSPRCFGLSLLPLDIHWMLTLRKKRSGDDVTFCKTWCRDDVSLGTLVVLSPFHKTKKNFKGIVHARETSHLIL